MNEVIMVKYGEIALKGLNKATFEDLLVKNIRRRLRSVGEFEYSRRQSTIYIRPLGEADLDRAIKRLGATFGIAAIQRSAVLPKDWNGLVRLGLPYLDEPLSAARTFKVEAKRSDKSYPFKTPDIQRELGAAILEAYPHLSVDVHEPDVTVILEIRDTNAYLNAERLKGPGGMPVGSSGNGLLLLSGGIDSPVAGYLMAKRGVNVDAIHFQSPPYTSDRALLKVHTLCEKLTPYCGDIRLYCVPFTEIQETLRDRCPEEYFTIVMRRLMLKIANRVCAERDYRALITGESLGQVASQTMHAIGCTDRVAEYPVFRPVIGMDKKEIIEISRKIDTYETSIEPYEDCCTVFTPKHPKTRPSVAEAEAAEGAFDYAPLLTEAIDGIAIKDFKLS
ncbi:MAG: tRNA 4-thiouridine(8) synthase ThiI [Bacteroides sp.]|nr:tRNA 4-thiouridine(8) synthase ThiI [Eubacterium sp.]MCM1418691.1 tRNA 4-thiouridine(8) synthase ThiI [Roseburia sp.]MCM1462719.1 tRNA 4-thiouridine(8) synthase ThiI [Bacteroides sp.]